MPKCCEQELKKTGKAFSGYNRHGDLFTCPNCGIEWVYEEDEAEGGYWSFTKSIMDVYRAAYEARERVSGYTNEQKLGLEERGRRAIK